MAGEVYSCRTDYAVAQKVDDRFEENPLIQAELVESDTQFCVVVSNIATDQVVFKQCTPKTWQDRAQDKADAFVKFFTEDAKVLGQSARAFMKDPNEGNLVPCAFGILTAFPLEKAWTTGARILIRIPGARRIVGKLEFYLIKYESWKYKIPLPTWEPLKKVLSQIEGDYAFYISRKGEMLVADAGSAIVEQGARIKGAVYVEGGVIKEVHVPQRYLGEMVEYVQKHFPSSIKDIEIIAE